MKRSYRVTLGLMVMVMVSLAFTNDEPRYKNLKVLPKDTNKHQMDSVMKHFSASLSVKCNYCHTYNQEQKSMDFASDANHHKLVAREMMQMTNKINKEYFNIDKPENLEADLQVTCYTCHNGKVYPATYGITAKPAEAAVDSVRKQ